MDAGTSAHHRPAFTILSEYQICRLYEATLACLERTGVNILNQEARALLAAAGARVDDVRVRIPARIVQDVLSAPRSPVVFWGRDGQRRLEVEPDRSYFGPGPTCTYFVDPETGQRRRTRRGDPGLAALVSDALKHIDYVMSLGLIGDVTAELAPVYEFAEMVANTSKPVLPWAYTLENVVDIYHIAVAVAGSEEALRARPFMALFATFQAPMIHTDHDVENVFWAIEHSIPVVYLGGGAAGSSAPVTGAGTLVTSLAAALSGLAFIHLKKPDAAVCLGAVPEAMDLRTGRPAYGSPEMSLYSAAMAEVLRYLRIPFMGTAGASEAKVLDQQSAIESTLQIVLSALSGAALVHDAGFLDCADIGSLEMLVMSDEIIGMARRVARGIDVSDEALMLDTIDEVGPAGEYMSHPETASRCRKEIWVPRLMDRQPWINWDAAGRLTMHERIKTRVREILATHVPAPLPNEVTARIQAVLEAAEARRRGPAGV